MKEGLSLLQKSYKKGNVEAQFLIVLLFFASGNISEKTFNLIKPIAEKDPSTIKKVYGIKGGRRKSIQFSRRDGFCGSMDARCSLR